MPEKPRSPTECESPRNATANKHEALCNTPLNSETGRIRFRRVLFQTPNAVGRKLSELLPAYCLCAKANSPSFSQNSPSLPQNSVRSLCRHSALETVFRPFPINNPPLSGTYKIVFGGGAFFDLSVREFGCHGGMLGLF